MDAKVFQEDLQSLSFTLSLAKPKMERRLGNEGPAHKTTGRKEFG